MQHCSRLAASAANAADSKRGIDKDGMENRMASIAGT